MKHTFKHAYAECRVSHTKALLQLMVGDVDKTCESHHIQPKIPCVEIHPAYGLQSFEQINTPTQNPYVECNVMLLQGTTFNPKVWTKNNEKRTQKAQNPSTKDPKSINK